MLSALSSTLPAIARQLQVIPGPRVRTKISESVFPVLSVTTLLAPSSKMLDSNAEGTKVRFIVGVDWDKYVCEGHRN